MLINFFERFWKMKNKDFFYLQYDRVDWENQEKTKINLSVNSYIIENVIFKSDKKIIKIFDIGFGIGFFLRMLYEYAILLWKETVLEWCEPSLKNFDYFASNKPRITNAHNTTFLATNTNAKFDFITAIYVFPHFIQEEILDAVKKIYSLLEEKWKFVLVVANEGYLKNKLKTMKDLFIEKTVIHLNGKEYEEVLHYTDIPEIGKVIDFNRDERFYIDLFIDNWFELFSKDDLDDNWFICSVFVFQKK